MAPPKQGKSDLDSSLFVAALGAIVCALPVALFAWFAWKNPSWVKKHKAMLVKMGTGIMAVCLGSYYFLTSEEALFPIHFQNTARVLGFEWQELTNFVLVCWGAGLGFSFLVAPFIAKQKKKNSDPFLVRQGDFLQPKGEIEEEVKKRGWSLFLDPERVPIGVNLKTDEVVFWDKRRRTYHVIVLGATGMGKTTFLLLLVLHAVYHEQPCIVIDPKGDGEFILDLLRYADKIAPFAKNRIKLFRLSEPRNSAQYNPLKHGNASQLKDKLLEALNWSEQYYQSISAHFLSEFISAALHLKLSLNLRMIRRALSQKSYMGSILKSLKDAALSGDSYALEVAERLDALTKSMKADDLLGLSAQLAVLDSPELGFLFSFQQSNNEIDLREVYAKNEIAYFQLDTVGNADTARRLGRMIVEDIKSLESYVYKEIPAEKRKFVPYFIDEFGSFASKEFIESLKQGRGAGLAAHLFSQGKEDLEVVSREFARQALSNASTVMALHLKDKDTVDAVCAMAGTADTQEQSVQVKDGLFGQTETGLGNMRDTKQMIVEHDVIKNLKVGTAVVVEKAPSRNIPVQIFQIANLMSGKL